MKEGEFQAVISTFNVVDHDGDMVLPGAFREQKVVISQYNHGSWNSGASALPIGVGRIFEQGNEALIEGEFDMDDPLAVATYRKLHYINNKGRTQEWSYSLPKIDYEMRNIEGQRVRVLKKIWVNEVSPVLMGASIGTRLLDIKGIKEECKLMEGPIFFSDSTEARLFAETARILKKYHNKQKNISRMDKRELYKIAEKTKERQEWIQDTFYHWYVQLEDRAVPEVKKLTAKIALDFFMYLFGTPWPVSIKWFRAHTPAERRDLREQGFEGCFEEFKSDNDILGCVRGSYEDKIWINAESKPIDIIGIVAHELVHIPQSQNMSKEAKENEAQQKAQWGVNIFYKERRELWESLQK